ncbi:hypothetical protein BC629DRAFT_1725870 [Irpex lacteus]|nr:hypothetical protein BC629DRAFT_1725870 [Irpex lacteus]
MCFATSELSRAMPQAPRSRQKSAFDNELHACQRELADFINHLFAIVANTGVAGRAGREGGIRFRRLTDEEFEEVRMELEPLLDAEAQKHREMRKQREDQRKKRQLRPIATRGIHRRAKGGIKSNEFVDGSDVDELRF